MEKYTGYVNNTVLDRENWIEGRDYLFRMDYNPGSTFIDFNELSRSSHGLQSDHEESGSTLQFTKNFRSGSISPESP